jgi:deoxycytidylate deaminase
LLQAGYSSYNATIYITDKPCHECERLIRAANIARIVTPMIGVNNG